METLILFFALLTGVAAALAAIAVWTPRKTYVRAAAVVVTAFFIPVGYLGLQDLLSKPKPMEHEWFKRHVDEAVVLGVSLEEGEAIYLWLRLDDSLQPRFYVLPWRTQLAEKLQNLIDEAIQAGATVTIKNPFSRHAFENLGDLNVNIRPPPSQPFKPRPPPAQIFNPREQDLKGA
ncbi:MAG TPA: hypothetical protein VGB36_03625 [Gammaproteobacteria bacterium]|jgi:hypothetical protein